MDRSALLLALLTVAVAAAKDDDKNKYKIDKNDEWWKKNVIYQVYPASFQDSDGDGIGDLKGIKSEKSHFKDIGVGGIWISPIYKSPMKDNGYDISDFKAINKKFGTLDDFKDLVKEFNDTGIKVIMDFVPNHTSDEHPWFQASIKNDDTYKDFYIWDEGFTHPPPNNNTPPNNWKSIFGRGNDSAWTWNDDRQAFYYHSFGTFQPDLNYRNPKVVEAMKDVLKFWLEQGVYGFRMDAVPFLVESDKRKRNDENPNDGCEKDCYFWGNMNHTQTLDQDETYNILAQFRDTLNNYTKNSNDTTNRIMMVEAYSPFNKTMAYYGDANKPIANFPFNFNFIPLNKNSNGPDFVNAVESWMNGMTDDIRWPNWVLGNHDQDRVGSRVGEDMIDAMNMINLLLPGTAITYYGEEIGMTNAFIREFERQDNTSTKVRDPERTPFQWNNTLNAGFSNTTGKLYLPVNPNYWHLNKKDESGSDKRSHLKNYIKLSKLHNTLSEDKGLKVTNCGKNFTFSFARTHNKDNYIVVVNLDNNMQTLNLAKAYKEVDNDMNLPKSMYVHIASINSDKKDGNPVNLEKVELRPKESIVLATSGASAIVSFFSVIAIALVFSMSF